MMQDIRTPAAAHLYSAVANATFAELGLSSRTFVTEDTLQGEAVEVRFYITSTRESLGGDGFTFKGGACPEERIDALDLVRLVEKVALREIQDRHPRWSTNGARTRAFQEARDRAWSLIQERFQALP